MKSFVCWGLLFADVFRFCLFFCLCSAHSAKPNLLLCIPLLFVISSIIKWMYVCVCARGVQKCLLICVVIEKNTVRYIDIIHTQPANERFNEKVANKMSCCQDAILWSTKENKTIWMRQKLLMAQRNHCYSDVSLDERVYLDDAGYWVFV